MNNHGLVSIITPSYNAGLVIGRTIESVLAQSYQNWELIVIDDCSKDDTCDVVKSYIEQDKRIRLLPLDQNNGAPAVPRNIGILAAKGEWVALLDSDDVWHPDKLKIQIDALNEAGMSFACSGMQDFSNDNFISFQTIKNTRWEKVSFTQQRLRARIPASSVIAKRELLLKYPFFEDISYKAVEDYHCWLRLLQETRFCLKITDKLLFYRKTDGQISGSKMYMTGRVFMMHRNFGGQSLISAMFYTATHILGGFYFRYLHKRM